MASLKKQPMLIKIEVSSFSSSFIRNKFEGELSQYVSTSCSILVIEETLEILVIKFKEFLKTEQLFFKYLIESAFTSHNS